ncbi:hypothetical protein [Umezawaea beigongshangensis]|uniref:hypothetical protein n=1 Tax=Umezawaea beigongshangensis TaxID=2780383 RepID=UPI0018F10C0B|nr:hypothetical protein [Umezawaea beigongshangensis]
MRRELAFFAAGIALGSRAGALRRLLRRPSREPGAAEVVVPSDNGFRLGPLTTGYVSLEGDGTRTIAEDRVHVAVTPEDVELPPELREWREQERARLDARNGGRTWNGLRFAVADFAIGRHGESEDPELWLTLKHSEYVNFLATQQLDRAFADGTTPRSRYLAGRSPADVPDFMSNSFGAHVAVITADDRLLLAKRGDAVAVQPGLWAASVSEGLARGMDGEAPGPHALARRGLHEELALDADEYDLELLSVGVATTVHQWVGLFTATLRTLTLQDLLDRLSRGSADPWENSAFEVVELTPEAVLSTLLREDRRERWISVVPPLLHFALVRRFGRAAVEQELAAVLRG